MKISCGQYETAIGRINIYADENVLYAVSFEADDDNKRKYLSKHIKDAQFTGPNVMTERAFSQITEFLSGNRRDFELEYKLFLSDFAQKVTECVLKIPYGETVTYSDIVDSMKATNAFRAVGNALNHNPLPIIIPCHRVNARGGMLSGYAGGTKAKRTILEIENRVKLISQSEIVSTDEIINPGLTAYVRSLSGEVFRKDILEYANKNNVPVSKPETLAFIGSLLSVMQPKKILEIGTAVGYGTLYMKSVCDAAITTVEKDEDTYKTAVEFTKGSGIEHILADGVKFARECTQKFDFIYVDCAKGQYVNLYDSVKKLLTEGGVALYDNVLYKGISAGLGVVKHKNRTIANNLITFNEMAMNDDEMQASLITLGDGLLMTVKRSKVNG